MTITLLVVSNYGAHAAPFLCRLEELAEDMNVDDFLEYDGTDANCLEEILDDAVAACDTDYILRLDDDELPSAHLVDWIRDRSYHEAPHWAFPRRNLFPTENSYILSHGLFPDYQTRCSTKAMSGGRHKVHVGSPHGRGVVAPCAINHHKFLVRSLPERRELLARYERLQEGAGRNFVQFSTPEDLTGLETAAVP